MPRRALLGQGSGWQALRFRAVRAQDRRRARHREDAGVPDRRQQDSAELGQIAVYVPTPFVLAAQTRVLTCWLTDKAVQAAAAQAVAAAASVPGSSTPPSASYMPTGVPQPPPQQHASPPQPTTTVPQADLLAQIAARQGGSFTPEQTAILLQLGYGGWSNGAATGDAARRNLPGQQTRRVNGLQTVEEATPKSHHQPTSAASYFPRGMQALYPEDTHEDLDADAAGARISNSVSMSALGSVAALGQGFSSE